MSCVYCGLSGLREPLGHETTIYFKSEIITEVEDALGNGQNVCLCMYTLIYAPVMVLVHCLGNFG